MLIGRRLREIREAKGVSQVEISRATKLVQPYVSRVENGHTIPTIETLEKWARALGMPLYALFYDGEGPPEPLILPSENEQELWGDSEEESQAFDELRQSLAKMNEKQRKILLSLAERMASRSVMRKAPR
jgi:transcriptional regulator with XRE-family HTH domain